MLFPYVRATRRHGHMVRRARRCGGRSRFEPRSPARPVRTPLAPLAAARRWGGCGTGCYRASGGRNQCLHRQPLASHASNGRVGSSVFRNRFQLCNGRAHAANSRACSRAVRARATGTVRVARGALRIPFRGRRDCHNAARSRACCRTATPATPSRRCGGCGTDCYRAPGDRSQYLHRQPLVFRASNGRTANSVFRNTRELCSGGANAADSGTCRSAVRVTAAKTVRVARRAFRGSLRGSSACYKAAVSRNTG